MRKSKIVLILIVVLILVVSLLFFTRGNSCDDKQKLGDLLKMDFMDVDIKNIEYKRAKEDAITYTSIYVFINISDEKKEAKKDYFFESEILTQGDIDDLKQIGIEEKSVLKNGRNYKDCVRWFSAKPYEISWYQLDSNHIDRGNMILIAHIPCKVNLDIEKIMQE